MVAGFKRLRKLEFGMELVVSNIKAIQPSRAPLPQHLFNFEGLMQDPKRPLDSLLGQLVPPSVLELSILAYPLCRSLDPDHVSGLQAMFHDFSRRRQQVPKLEQIHLDCSVHATEDYKKECAKIRLKTHIAGVKLRLRISASPKSPWGEGSFFGRP